MKASGRIKLSILGLAFGAIGLLIAVLHFGADAFTPSPPIEQVVADKAVAIRDTTVARLLGKPAPVEPPASAWNTDRAIALASTVLGSLAIVLSVFGFTRRESFRACVGAALLGIAAIAFPYVVGALSIVIILLALGALISGVLG